MNNKLYVTVKEETGNEKVLVFFVAVGCPIKEAIEEIKEELEEGYTFISASYNR